MFQRVLAVLLILSWMILSGVDILEDLASDGRPTATASSSPTTAKQVKLANDTVELANRTLLSCEQFFIRKNLNSPILPLLDSDSRVLRSHKDNCVFLI
jgi:hypothetical protein